MTMLAWHDARAPHLEALLDVVLEA